jgi:hypothetical protein
MPWRGAHALGLAAILFTALAVRSTEFYTSRYQTLPVLDWLEARPPLADVGDVPPAADLARGIVRASPLLTIRDDVRPLVPLFGPPAEVQRTIGGVRDAARLELGPPNATGTADVPVFVRLDVVVFTRAIRASAYADLLAREFDIRDPEKGVPQTRLTGAAEMDHVWLTDPRRGGGEANVTGFRGAVAYQLRVIVQRPSEGRTEDRVDLNARAEALARRVGADWSRWLEVELGDRA